MTAADMMPTVKIARLFATITKTLSVVMVVSY
jgi:hypothetical protein